MKKLALAVSFILFGSMSVTADTQSRETETEPLILEATLGWVAGEIVDAAGSAIQSGIKSALTDAIFGPSGPAYVHLSQESLAEIENIVQAGFDTYVNGEMISRLSALEEIVKAYNDSLSLGHRPESMVTTLEERSHELNQSQAFRTDKPYYTDLTIQESLAATLSYAIYADKVHYGENSTTYLESLGNNLADKVEARGAATELRIGENVTFTSIRTTQCTILYSEGGEFQETDAKRYCYNYVVRDEFAGDTYRYDYRLYGPSNGTMASNRLSSLKSEYRNLLKGERYNEIVTKLRTEY